MPSLDVSVLLWRLASETGSTAYCDGFVETDLTDCARVEASDMTVGTHEPILSGASICICRGVTACTLFRQVRMGGWLGAWSG